MGLFKRKVFIANWLGLRPAGWAKLARQELGNSCAPWAAGRESQRMQLGRYRALLIAMSLLAATSALAQVVFDVNDTGDDIDANVLDGKCETPLPAKTCTLRAAVMQANRIPNAGATINVPAGTYKLTIPASISDGEENGDLDLIIPVGYAPGPTTITGAGSGVTIVDGQGQTRILHVGAGRAAFISGIALINGSASDAGGGIYNDGMLHLTHSLLMHNAANYDGGGIYSPSSGGTVDIDFSVFSLNSAEQGGAIYAGAGTTSLAHSTLDSNSASQGGGIYSLATVKVDRSTLSRNTADYGGALKSNGSLVVTNSTISQNHGNVAGGGIYSVGPTSVYNSTIAYNQTYSDTADEEVGGAGVNVVAVSTFDAHNSILAGNFLVIDGSYNDCSGYVGFYGKSGFEGGTRCFTRFGSPGFAIPVDSTNELGVLTNNGGPTETIALMPSSGMIGAGIASECADPGGHINTDQRGKPRPPAGRPCDIGAFEYNEVFAAGFETPPAP